MVSIWTDCILIHHIIHSPEKVGIVINETHKRSVTGDSEKLELAFEVAIWLGWMNSAINPIIYYSNQEVTIFWV